MKILKQKSEASVEAFLQSVDDIIRRDECKKLVNILPDISCTPPKMSSKSLIGFGRYHYKYKSGQEGDWPVVAYSPLKQYLTVYIMPGFSKYGALMDNLGKYKTGMSCLYLQKFTDIDINVLEEPVRRSVNHMLKIFPETSNS